MSSPRTELVVAIDSGTSSTKVVASDASGQVLARASAPIGLQTPRPGWVEQDPREIVVSCERAVEQLLEVVDPAQVVAVGISNQRESLLLWDRSTGEPVSPVLSWQDRRTGDIARSLRSQRYGATVRRIGGLPLDPMFSAAKATWLLDAFDPRRLKAGSGEYALGTIDSWLVWSLTGQHVTEPGNASRTSLLDIAAGTWSAELLDIFGVPVACLPALRPSAGPDLTIRTGRLSGRPLSGVLGDSHAALFHHRGWRAGTAKVTLGTGSSVMATVDAGIDAPGLCRTVAWQLPGAAATMALEGNILSAGATIVWLAGILGMTPEQLADEAEQAGSGGRVALVPAFDGLGAPWWDPEATGLISGLSLSTTRADLARAALDSVVMQVADLVREFTAAGVSFDTLIADGGMTQNAHLLQDLADQTSLKVRSSPNPEASALGAADIAGLGAGLWDLAALESRSNAHREVTPREGRADARATTWASALSKARSHT